MNGLSLLYSNDKIPQREGRKEWDGGVGSGVVAGALNPPSGAQTVNP